MVNHAHNYSVFIADDDKDDQMFICNAFEELGIAVMLRTFENGKLLLDYLTKNNTAPAGSDHCSFVMLDLNMPVLDGIQTLRQMRKTNTLDKMPVVILSTSNRAKDVNTALEQKANGYICKPLKCSEYKRIADALVRFWSGAEVEDINSIKFLRRDFLSASLV